MRVISEPADDLQTVGAPPIRSVSRAIAVLRVFEDGRSHRITEIAESTGFGASTVHRLVRALCDSEVLEQSSENSSYRLSLVSAVIGRAAIDRFAGSTVHRELEALHRRIGESTSFGIPGQGAAHVLLRLRSEPTPLLERDIRGGPPHACVLGKVFLAWGAMSIDDLPPEPYQRFTPSTITTRAALEADIQATRARGYSLLDDERLEGVRAVAVPVWTRDGTLTAALSCYGPGERFSDDLIDSIVPFLQEAARRMTHAS
jgi:IclR family acetate operon transcriptional repressor